MKEAASASLKFVPISLRTVKLVLFSDVQFENTRVLRRKLGYVLLLADTTCNGNLIPYGSNCRIRLIRSVLALEVHGIVLELDYAMIIQHIISQLLGRTIAPEASLDGRTIFDVVAKDGPST